MFVNKVFPRIFIPYHLNVVGCECFFVIFGNSVNAVKVFRNLFSCRVIQGIGFQYGTVEDIVMSEHKTPGSHRFEKGWIGSSDTVPMKISP